MFFSLATKAEEFLTHPRTLVLHLDWLDISSNTRYSVKGAGPMFGTFLGANNMIMKLDCNAGSSRGSAGMQQ